MIPIELKKRYPHSREEDITDAFMRGYQACAVQGGDAEMDNCQVQAPQNCMQQSRHDDGKDLISRADAVNAVHKYFVDAFNNEPHEIDEDGDDVFTDMKSVNALLHHNKYVSKAIKALPSAEAGRGEWIGYNADKEDWLRTDGTPIFLVCDKCHGTVINNGSAHWNYCPNCGAKMKGGDTE